ncbi:anthrone oxygenase family protein [Streptosporangium sandarakinum]
MFELFRSAALVASTLAMGLTAGLFAAFAYAVMPGLGRGGDRTFVEAMRQINVAILNGWFALAFGGALVLTLLAAALHLRGDSRSALPWIVAALVLYGLVLAVTFAVNVPLNDRLAAAGTGDLAAAREHFEAAWVRWNVIRAAASTAAFGCLAWALVVHGASAAPGGGA